MAYFPSGEWPTFRAARPFRWFVGRIDTCGILQLAAPDLPIEASGPAVPQRTIEFPWALNRNHTMFEYACHDGNYALGNILRATLNGR